MSKMFSPGFSQRILMIALGGFLVSTLLITLVILKLAQDESRQILLKQQHNMGKMVVRRLENTIEERKLLLEKFANQLSDGHRLYSQKVIQANLNSRIGLHHFFNGGMLVLDVNAVTMADSPVVQGRSGIDFSDRTHVKTVRKLGATVITRPTIGRGLKSPVFAINSPIKAVSGEILGFIFGVTRLADNNLFQEIGKEFLGGQASMMIIDPNLRLFVTASDPKLAMQELPPPGKNLIIDKVLAGVPSGYLRDSEGRMSLFTATKFDLMAFEVIHTLPEAVLQANDRHILVRVSLLIIGFTLIIGLAVWLLLHRQLMVLRTTSNSIVDMVEGKQPFQALHVQNDDEIGNLITAFNRLQQRLTDNIDVLEQNNRELEKRVEQRTFKMKAAMLEAEEANSAKTKFLSRMSHELRTPLNAILGFAQVLELDNEQLSQSQQSYVKEILEAGTYLLHLINEILDLAKIESGQNELTMERVKVCDVIQQSLKLINTQADARQIEITDRVSDKGHFVQADFTRLKQVMINLLTNAVKYNCAKGRILLESTVTNHQRLRIGITDTGDGLSETEIRKLFTPFERLNALHVVEGTGIGLVITKHWIELMDGIIGVDSVSGKGSTFWIELALSNDSII